MKGNILLIDDNPMDLKVITSVLEREGYACHGFTDYAQGLNWLLDHKPQIIFLDLQMPRITGYELIPILKKRIGAETPIIIISGKNQSEDVVRAIQLGAVDYIVKPIDPMVLLEKVQKTDSKEKSEYFQVDIADSAGLAAHVRYPLEIRSVSEFGLRLKSTKAITPGTTFELYGISKENFAAEHLLLRSLSCEEFEGVYRIQATFIGLTEAQRQTIRKFCKQCWLESKRRVS